MHELRGLQLQWLSDQCWKVWIERKSSKARTHQESEVSFIRNMGGGQVKGWWGRSWLRGDSLRQGLRTVL